MVTISLTVKEKLVLSAIKTQARLVDGVYFITNTRKNVAYYAKQIGAKISDSQINKALRKLVSLSLIEKDSSRTLSERKIVYRLKNDNLGKANIEVKQHKKKLPIPPKARTLLKLTYMNSLVLEALLKSLAESRQKDNIIYNIRKTIAEYFRAINQIVVGNEIEEAIEFFEAKGLLKNRLAEYDAYEFDLNLWQNEFTMIISSPLGREEEMDLPKENLIESAEAKIKKLESRREILIKELRESDWLVKQLKDSIENYQESTDKYLEAEQKKRQSEETLRLAIIQRVE